MWNIIVGHNMSWFIYKVAQHPEVCFRRLWVNDSVQNTSIKLSVARKGGGKDHGRAGLSRASRYRTES